MRGLLWLLNLPLWPPSISLPPLMFFFLGRAFDRLVLFCCCRYFVPVV